jgi:hypothetical protein
MRLGGLDPHVVDVAREVVAGDLDLVAVALAAMVTGRVLEIVPVALRLRPVTTPSMVMVTIEAVRSQRTVCQLPSLTLTVDPAETALLPAEPRNRQTILPLGCSNFQ